MKKILIACLVGFGLQAVDTGKKPVVLKKVNSFVKDKYIIWTTEIKKDPAADKDPIVSQFQKGYVDSGRQSDEVNVTLHIPQSEIDLSSKIPGAAAEIAGAVNPKAGLVGGAAALIINEGLSIAGKELTKANQRSPFNLTVVQIAPSKYYRLVSDKNNPNGKIEVTKQFKEDWKKWKAIKKAFSPVLREYNDAVIDYQKLYQVAKSRPNDKGAVQKAQQALAKVGPGSELMKKKLSFEQQLKAYPLYRAAIMAVIPTEGTSCKAGSGPWQLHLFIYVGARVTNKYVIDFCVPKKNNEQQFNVLISNDYHKQGTAQFIPGGIQLATSDNISFPVSIDGITDYASKNSVLYDWYTEFITSTMGDTIDQYLFPFDIYKMQQEYEQKMKDKEIARRDEDFKRLKDAIEKVKSSKGIDELSNSDSDISDSGTIGNDTSDAPTDDSSNDLSGDDSDSNNSDDEGYFPQLKEIKEEIDNRSKDSTTSISAKKELEIFNRIAENYLEVVNAQVIIKEEDVKVGSAKAKELLFNLNLPRTEFYTVQKDIKALTDSHVKTSLLTLAESLVEATKLLITQIETGKKPDGSSGTKSDDKKPSKLKQVGSKALEFLKENVTADNLKKVPDLLKSVFGK